MMPERYRPSNSTEGWWFESQFCERCKHMAAWLADDRNDACDINTRALALEIDHPNYPTEWIEIQSGPLCTAFEATGGDDGTV
jgi:hypothetical protein